MNIFIYAQPYDPNSGGTICLHRLCHIINTSTQHNAYLVPDGIRYFPKQKNNRSPLLYILKKLRNKYRSYKRIKHYITQTNWNTPVYKSESLPKDAVVIYPEISENNPLNAQNVVRWLLHQPGFHTGKINYGNNELYFKFNSAILDFKYKNSTLSEHHLKVIYYPIDLYYPNKEQIRDIECCYMIRKGQNKHFIHNENDILLDNKSHQEIADIFRRSKRFICYDDYTAYSLFAVLCDCESVVIPEENKAIEDWYPDIKDRYGIAYGLTAEQLSWANQSKGSNPL